MARKITGNSRLVRAFRDQSGSMTFFIMIMFITMIGVAGIAIDIARFEANRSQIQAHLDNATLAAASSRQRKTEPFLTEQQIIDSYMESQGLAGVYDVVVVDDGEQIGDLNTTYRVEANATSTMNTIFMHMFGVNQLDLSVVSAAEEGIPRIEVSLVLDVSGSMAGERMSSLQTGAKEFVDLMLGANTENNPARVSLSLVPYNMQVNAGEHLWDAAMRPSRTVHNYSYCAEWTESGFAGAGFSKNKMVHAMSGSYGNVSGNYYNSSYGEMERPECTRASYAHIRPISNDAGALKAQIDSFVADGATSIDLGVKWGVALLDPSSRDEITRLVESWEVETDENGDTVMEEGTNNPVLATDADGNYIGHYQSVHPGFAGRPSDYDGETKKILVVMTDGQNTQQKYVKSSYRDSGNSGVWYNPNNFGENKFRFSSSGLDSSWSQMNWIDMWAHIPTKAYVNNKGGSASTYSANIEGSDKDTRLSAICAKARNKGIIVYSIAYGATPTGQTAMSNCAGNPNNYKVATPDTISATFGAIFDSISKLRLTN